jgi:Na+-transporting NADH:ubiquinone oxidoreductase subunit D
LSASASRSTPAPLPPGLGQESALLVFQAGMWGNNPIAVQILGICSALAVTTRLENALVMGVAVTFVTAMSSLLVSLLRGAIPRRLRMIAEVAIISAFVIAVDQFLQAYYFDMSKRLGAYVGLIITNCIVMGREEAFALHRRPVVSLIDGAANGLGYAAILAAIGLVRELGGSGRLVFGDLALVDLTGWYTPNQLLVMAPGAFIALGFLVALLYVLGLRKTEPRPAGGGALSAPRPAGGGAVSEEAPR